ncbi:MAG: alpha/beta fold hydrolase [Psychroflexus sp.]|nr:alpha/beta fold hydrolase [Psychroflexus sp.]MDN6309844.1 alpha/beta fold hydrolase [Psychroflexus sp.]
MDLYANVIGQGKPLLILHGFLGMGDNWKTLAKRYAEEQDYEVHLIDQRNHGRSPHSDDFNYNLLADDLKNYMDKHQLNTADIIGHSMGGKTVMTFAAHYPEYVNKLIVVDIAPKYYAPHHQKILDGLTAVDEACFESRKDADDLLSDYIKIKSIRQFLLKNLYRKNKKEYGLRVNLESLKAHVNEIGKALDAEETFDGETLFINGEKSDYITANETNLIKNHFPNSKIQPIKDAGHWVHAEQSDEFFNVTSAFLS